MLIINSVMILHRKRFLAKYGLDDLNNLQQNGGGGGAYAGGDNPLKANIVGLLHAVQYLKMPIIAANAITILFELIFGS